MVNFSTFAVRAHNLTNAISMICYISSTTTTHRACNYLRMINPSTGEVCLEGVPAVVDGKHDRWNMAEPTVKCALAWRDGDDWFKCIDEKRPSWQTPEYVVDSNGNKITIGYNKPVVLT